MRPRFTDEGTSLQYGEVASQPQLLKRDRRDFRARPLCQALCLHLLAASSQPPLEAEGTVMPISQMRKSSLQRKGSSLRLYREQVAEPQRMFNWLRDEKGL